MISFITLFSAAQGWASTQFSWAHRPFLSKFWWGGWEGYYNQGQTVHAYSGLAVVKEVDRSDVDLKLEWIMG